MYLFWGSTYVAIRFGVEVLSPFFLGSVRFLVAGPLMLGLCAARGMRLRPASWRDFGMLAAIGVLMLGIGNMGLVWSEQYLPSGLAALLIAVVPVYVALVEAVLPNGEGLRSRGWLGIGIGFAGLLILVSPGLLEVKTSAFVAAGWEMLFAGIFNVAILLVTGEGHHQHWSAQGFWSVTWLVVFGSLVGYTAYIYLLEHVPVAKVATYAYVNPVVAVILGALLLQERLVPIEYAGMAAILAAVYLVTSSKLKSGAPAAEIELSEAEWQA